MFNELERNVLQKLPHKFFEDNRSVLQSDDFLARQKLLVRGIDEILKPAVDKEIDYYENELTVKYAQRDHLIAFRKELING